MNASKREERTWTCEGLGSCWSCSGIRTGFGSHAQPATPGLFLERYCNEFHMPSSMYLSGYVKFLSGAGTTNAAKWPVMVKSALRACCCPPHFGLGIIGGKWLASQFFHVDNMPGLFPKPCSD